MVPDLADRLAVVERVLADPPSVHPLDSSSHAPLGVWSTEDSCYRFVAEHCPEGTRTLETGCGVSTVLFAALGAHHICCTAGRDEADRVLAHCQTRRIPCDRLHFEVGSSHRSLPTIERGETERDLVLIDGSHAFPLPIVDWFYGAATLGSGGILVVDDIDLPAARLLRRFLDQDPRWSAVAGTKKWRAWQRLRSGTLSEDWTEQPFYRSAQDRVRRRWRGLTGRARRVVRRTG